MTIKFRAWDERSHQYIAPRCVTIDGKGNVFILEGFNEDGKYYHPELGGLSGKDLLIELYTGYADKTGKDVYVGDILKDVGVVTFGTFYAYLQNGLDGSYYITGFYLPGESGEPSMPLDNCERDEVIGNIHQNPELLND